MRASVFYGERKFEYFVSINNELADRVRIHVHPNGTVEVESPAGKSDHEIAEAILKRARWIGTNLSYFEKLRKHALPRNYVSGETHFYLGKRYQLKVLESYSGSSRVRLIAGQIQVELRCLDSVAVKRRLNAWYKDKAERYFQERIDLIGKELVWVDVIPSIKLMKMRTQWGSCSPSGKILLNPMLIKAPRECIDYVIIHELCHLQEHNHSKKFYSLLEKALPVWKHYKSKLDGMAELLLAE
jgi:predicted metal-dependent hydrolase